MSIEHFDVVVIGAGIHGAGAAQAAAACGYSVLVLEQTAVAGGTSSRSSKLIHGGLRYLESAQFGLVRECLHERAVLLRIAPELVRLRPFHIPIYRASCRRPWQIRLGLSLYALFGGLAAEARFSRVARGDWARLDGLETRDLRTVFRYYDAQTDDAALTRAVLRSAQELGAQLALPARFEQAERHVEGLRVLFSSAGRQHECTARVLINAAGPWVNEVLACVTPMPSTLPIDLVQGSHIVLPGQLNAGMYYLEAADGRAVFAMPWHEGVLVGTTETLYHGVPQTVQPLTAECDYLKQIMARYFPCYRDAAQLRVLSAFAGLRVLPARNGAAFPRPRETVLHVDQLDRPRVLTIYGGKLTAYRATAQKVLQRLTASLPAPRAQLATETLPLTPDV